MTEQEHNDILAAALANDRLNTQRELNALAEVRARELEDHAAEVKRLRDELRLATMPAAERLREQHRLKLAELQAAHQAELDALISKEAT